jgi:two-component system, OmpR family, phosphate regulon sensor histidine kinase PhoR
VKHVLARHNGKLEISSQPGKGSQFTCLLPPERIVDAKPAIDQPLQ